MTPRRLDPALIQERLREIQLLLGRSPHSYADSFDQLARAGVLEWGLAAALRPSAGMRNVLVHDYLEVDHGKVSAAIPLALEQYGQYVRNLARWLRSHGAAASDPGADE
ncbi:MAG: HepT-like ribonuclease domain-containing protein [Pseudonocardiaceae bacterium]